MASTLVGELSFVMTSWDGTSMTWVRRSIFTTFVITGNTHRNPGFMRPVYRPSLMASPCS